MKRVRGKNIFVVDIGNTNTSLGLYRGLRKLGRIDVPTYGATIGSAERAIQRLAGRVPLEGAVLASVVPGMSPVWIRALEALVPPRRVIHVSCKVHIGIPISYPKPETIGADRLANACGAAHRFGVPVIVADFGTAVTFDVVEAKRGYVGGIIAPGLMLMFSYLAEKTALLPSISPASVRGRVGRSTEQAMQLGAKWGYRGLVREILAELMRAPALKNAVVCATGGAAQWCLRGSHLRIAVDPDLTLYGLARIYQLNSHDADTH